MRKYKNGYKEKIQYWREQLELAISENQVEAITKASQRLAYFTQRQKELEKPKFNTNTVTGALKHVLTEMGYKGSLDCYSDSRARKQGTGVKFHSHREIEDFMTPEREKEIIKRMGSMGFNCMQTPFITQKVEERYGMKFIARVNRFSFYNK